MKSSNRLHAAILVLFLFTMTLLTSCFPAGHAPHPGNYKGNNGNHGQKQQKVHHDNGNHNGQGKHK